jgi:hypothetical protein
MMAQQKWAGYPREMMKLLCVVLFLSDNRKAIFPTSLTIHDPCSGYESICYVRYFSSHTQEKHVVSELQIAVVHAKFHCDSERRFRPNKSYSTLIFQKKSDSQARNKKSLTRNRQSEGIIFMPATLNEILSLTR